MPSTKGKAARARRIGAGGTGCGGFLILVFVVLLLADLPVLLKALGLVLGLAAAFVTAGVLLGAVQHGGGWRALFRRIGRTITRPFRKY